jgi:hypothetical protein
MVIGSAPTTIRIPTNPVKLLRGVPTEMPVTYPRSVALGPGSGIVTGTL